MKLTELLAIQKELNAKIGGSPKTYSAINMALIEECGELSRSLRHKWRWWEWKQTEKDLDPDAELFELVDILHFLLTLIEFEESKRNGDIDMIWLNDVWEDGASFAFDSLDKHLIDLLKYAAEGELPYAIRSYLDASQAVGYTRDRVEQAFLLKAQINHDRATTQANRGQLAMQVMTPAGMWTATEDFKASASIQSLIDFLVEEMNLSKGDLFEMTNGDKVIDPQTEVGLVCDSYLELVATGTVV